MPFDWMLFIKILQAILRIIISLPPDVDVRPIAQATDDAIETVVNGGIPTK